VDIGGYPLIPLGPPPGIIIRKCVHEDEMLDILKACHNEPCGGNFIDKRRTYKALPLRYYGPTLFRDAKEYF